MWSADRRAASRVATGTMLWIVATACGAAEPQAPFWLAPRAEAVEILRTEDEFTRALGPFDRSSRVGVVEDPGRDAFLRFVGEQALDWSESRAARVVEALGSVSRRLDAWSLPLPVRVPLLLTTGDEEGGAAYTRATAIVLPRRIVDGSGAGLERLLLHELFHVLSRHDRRLRDRLYAVVGFERCGEVEIPAGLRERRITNPDAPVVRHRLRIEHDGREIDVVPVLFSSAERFDPTKGGGFFRYLRFRLLEVEAPRTAGQPWRAALDGDGPRLLDPDEVPGFHARIGRNTRYIIHPEEVLADNFVLLLTGASEVPSPEILRGMERVLRSREAPESDGGSARDEKGVGEQSAGEQSAGEQSREGSDDEDESEGRST